MLQRLSASCQKEIALSFIALFFISGLYEVKAGIGRELNSGYYSSTNTAAGYLEKSNAVHPVGNIDLSNLSEAAGILDDEKNRRKSKAALKINAKSTAGLLSAKRTFDEPFIGGPSQPEMTAFKSVGSDNMVSPFTGDFSYNIPLLDVGGYPVNMFYNSGITMDQEASWVGLGWNINPGTVTRNMRGLPDDFDGTDMVTKRQSFRPDKTWGVSTGADVEFAGFPVVGLGVEGGASFNNKLGIATEAGVHTSFGIGGNAGDVKTASLSVSASLNASSRSGASFSPSVKFEVENQKGKTGGLTGSIGVGYTYSSRQGLSSMHLNANVGGKSIDVTDNVKVGGLSFNSTVSFAYPSIMPSISKPFTKTNYSLSFAVGLEYWWVNPSFKLRGYYSQTELAPEDKSKSVPAYGMLNLSKANDDKDALLDFNRANDGVYTPGSPAMAMPVYTYDVFNITGEGTGGSFRAYRGDIGHMHDPTVATKEEDKALGLHLGFGNVVMAGVDLSYVHSPTEAGDWKTNNGTGKTFSFTNNKNTFQAAYFKNPGEKTIPDADYQNAIGNDDIVRFKLGNPTSATPLLLPTLIRYDGNRNKLGEKLLTENTRKITRDKRTQVISFLTAEESERIGMNTKIYAIKNQGAYENKVIFNTNCNKDGVDSLYRNHQAGHNPAWPPVLGGESDPFRKKNHISEINVLGSDGRKYVYGLPVYNKRQVDVSFSINKTQKQGESKVIYEEGDNTDGNIKGRDWIMDQQEMPAYTHSYLLTELLSPNYVDVTGNGLTEDDMGDGIKFNYSKADDYKWRTPVGENNATYSEGLKTDIKDDRAHYIYGEREAWYLYTIESKNMVARFYIKNDRKDGRAVLNEVGELDPAKGMQRLDKISLFSKGDLTKYGEAAKPIKTIRFFQSYKLCKNAPGANDLGSNSINNFGKLTLDSIWITYNGNQRKPKSRYVFYYPANNNPDYYFDSNDRWGNYKPSSDNPNGLLLNADYPYSVQDKTKADKNAAAWTMNKILLPSGGVINVDYESDTYAYVQDKKAASMCKVLGFGRSATLPSANELGKIYTNDGENDHVYIQLPNQITAGGKAELKARYLADDKQLYLKLAVEMPMGAGLAGIAGSENIGIYADILDYGLVSPGVAWIKVKPLNNQHMPMVQGALQFLRQQLPGKAYKGYDVSENAGGKAIVSALSGMVNSLKGLFEGEFEVMIGDKKCQDVILDKSFAKLSVPDGNKYGGGLRVKRIVINDNWAKMANKLKATYGQEYKYTTSELINGKLESISSGVAAWEPIIGGDENPHRQIMRYLDHNKGGPYDYGSIEMPLGEMLYPSPFVGYSRVEILAIHRDTVKNLPTRQVTEFYTNKDFPYKSTCTDLSGDANVKYEPSLILQLLKIDAKKYITQSQGFLVETNDMNGKEKSHATYSALDSVNPVSITRNFYNTKQATGNTFSFTHSFPTLNKADGVVTNSLIGRDIELMTDFRQHKTETISRNIGINFNLFQTVFPFPVFLTLSPTTREGTMYRSAAVLKVVTHYGMLDSVQVIDKGSMVSTKNLLYDAETGNPLLTRTQNEHNKPVYNFSYPAHWAYSGMGPAYKNIDAVYSKLNFEHGILTNAALNAPGLLENVLESGDEIYILAKNNSNIPLSLPCDINEPSNTAWTTLKKNEAFRIWAVNTAKVGAANPQFLFMDSIGNPYNAMEADIRIIRSGHRNILDQSVGNITSLNNPVQNNQLVFTEATNIVQTAAATFKDHWRVDNSFYLFDSVVTQTRWAPIHPGHIVSLKSYSVGMYRRNQNGASYFPKHFVNTDYILARNQSFGGGNNSKKKQKSWDLFDINNATLQPPLTSASVIVSAKLSLYSHKDDDKNQFNSIGPFVHLFSYHNVDPEYGHGNTDPHWYRYGSNHGNNFKVSRIIGQWSPDNSNDWVSYHYPGYEVNALENQVAVFGTQPINPSAKDYVLNASDDRIEFTNVFRGMLRDKLDPAKQYAAGIKLSMLYDGDDVNDLRVCFNGALSPAIDIKYYNCSEAYPFGYNPSPQEEVAACMTTVFRETSCRSKFTQRKSINPYVEGIFGNWRVDSTYAYYGDRKEDNPNNPVDTRTGGTIKDYKSFWNFAAANTSLPITRNQQAVDVWVWNSAITQYNRKGYEIENTDPLGRFNAGLYGYNQQLPTAVANNARVREIMFDGFEDYDYETSSNCIDCKPHRFFNYDAAITSKIDATQKHTGRNSLRLSAGETIKLKAPVTTLAEANKDYSFRLMDTANTITGSVLGTTVNGTGVQAKYYNHPYYNTPLEPGVNSSAVLLTQQNRLLKLQHPQGPVSLDYFSVKWSGKLQFPQTGSYKFTGYADNCFRLKINGQQVTSQTVWTGGSFNTETTQPQTFTLGQVVDIEVSYYDWSGGESFNLQWEATSGTTTIIPKADIPVTALYAPTATTFNPIINTTVYCTRLDSSNVRGSGLTDTFSLIQSKKMLLSAWVKVGTINCCFPATYGPVNNVSSNSIAIGYTGGSNAPLMYPAGSIIEGWQRYESVFDVPATATSIDVSLKNNTTSGNPQLVFFDDVRIQPYNANMKSFVYHSSNLRLMAELDENNYASFYEYDDDGTLTRLKKETVKGIKTITETRSAIQKKIVSEN